MRRLPHNQIVETSTMASQNEESSPAESPRRPRRQREEAVATASPPKRQRVDEKVNIVTPSTRKTAPSSPSTKGNAQRNLFPSDTRAVTPSRQSKAVKPESPAKRKLIFGRLTTQVVVKDSVNKIYSIVRKLTGSLGGNGSHGPIYGELTMGSMQKMINLMKEHTGFDETSRFIDVGSGIGKPNLHVAQDPGVEFSYGIEVEYSRWVLGLNCLKGMLDSAAEEIESTGSTDIKHHCYFAHADMRDAKSFDPFTHVYMFSIGFPPTLWDELSKMWNRSSSPYLICYHAPKDIITKYEFNVELVTQTPTSMHGSKEGHMGYIYRRTPFTTHKGTVKCDPLFKKAWELCKGNLDPLKKHVDDEFNRRMTSGTTTRSKRSHLA